MKAPSLSHGDAVLLWMPDGPVSGVEVGVCCGELSDYLGSARPDLTLTMVDSWARDPLYTKHCKVIGDPNGNKNAMQVEAERVAAYKIADLYGFKVIERPSIEAVEIVDNASQDFVFIDADHCFEAAYQDCCAWLPKVKPGGWIGGHDYNRFKDDGVGRAVRQFAGEHHLTIKTGIGWTWFCRIGGHDAA